MNLNGMFRGCGDGLIVRSRLLSDRLATSWFPQGNWARRIIPRIIYRLGKPCNSPRIWWYIRDTTLFFPIWDINLLDLIVWNFIWRLIQNQENDSDSVLTKGRILQASNWRLISFLWMSSQSPKNWCYFSLSKKIAEGNHGKSPFFCDLLSLVYHHCYPWSRICPGSVMTCRLDRWMWICGKVARYLHWFIHCVFGFISVLYGLRFHMFFF